MNANTEHRTVVLGLDSIDLILMRKWASEGHLPFFARCLETLPMVRLATPSRALQGAIWPSLLTGMSPGRHGLYLQDQLETGTYRMTERRADFSRLRYYYEFLMEAGVKCGIADVPVDRPVADFKGLHIIDWGTEFRFWDYATQPPELADEIRQHIGDHPLDARQFSGDSQQSHLKVLQQILEGIDRKAALARRIIDRSELDHIFVVFGEPHKAGHWLWKYWDETHPNHEAAPTELRTGLLDCYQRVDRALDALCRELAEDTNLIIFSDHGMQANYRGEHLIRPILQKMGYLRYLDGKTTVPGADKLRYYRTYALKKLPRAVRNLLKRLVPQGAKTALNRALDQDASVDWSQTRAFILPTDRNTYIRINLKGREPEGTVSPGEEYRAVLNRIEETLRALVNPATGKPAVRDVYRLREVYPGDREEDLPDLAILWCADAPIDSVRSPTLGTIEGSVRELRSGNHRAEGFLFARGPAFTTGPACHDGDIKQLTPTLLTLHGVPVPAQFELGPLQQILRQGQKSTPSIGSTVSAD